MPPPDIVTRCRMICRHITELEALNLRLIAIIEDINRLRRDHGMLIVRPPVGQETPENIARCIELHGIYNRMNTIYRELNALLL